jgi:hypothetical protein
MERFLEEHATRTLNDVERTSLLDALEMQRNAMLMYTSCGWFFDELTGIETIQILHYAMRVIDLIHRLAGEDPEEDFLSILGKAQSNRPELGDGRSVWNKMVQPAVFDLPRIGALYAMSLMFDNYPRTTDLYCYHVELEDLEQNDTGQKRMVLGRARVTSKLTGENALVSFGALHLGDHNLNGGIRLHMGEDACRMLVEEGKRVFMGGDVAATVQFINKYFAQSTYSLKSLFKDQQQQILEQVPQETLRNVEESYRNISSSMNR